MPFSEPSRLLDAYETLVERLDLTGKSQSIYNADEGGLQHCFLSSKTVAERGANIVERARKQRKE